MGKNWGGGRGTYGKEIITKLDSGSNVRWDVEWNEVILARREQLIALRLTNIDLQHMVVRKGEVRWLRVADLVAGSALRDEGIGVGGTHYAQQIGDSVIADRIKLSH